MAKWLKMVHLVIKQTVRNWLRIFLISKDIQIAHWIESYGDNAETVNFCLLVECHWEGSAIIGATLSSLVKTLSVEPPWLLGLCKQLGIFPPSLIFAHPEAI